MNEFIHKVLLAIVIIISTIFSRDLFDNIHKKSSDFSDKHKDLAKFILITSILYSFTRDLQTTTIGLLIFLFIDI